jgi:signal transduction histidine kinase
LEPQDVESPTEALSADQSRRLQNLLRIIAKVAAGDFSEKPPLDDTGDEISQFSVGFRFMLEDLEMARAEEATQREESRRQRAILERIVASGRDGILLLDRQGKVLLANEQFADQWHARPQDVATATAEWIQDVIAKASRDPAATQRMLGRMEQGGEDRQLDLRLADGRRLDAFSAPLRSEEGQPYGRGLCFRDVSEFHEQDHELKATNRRLRELNDQKTAFINMMAHELSTPLTPVQLQIHLIRTRLKKANDEKLVNGLDVLARNIERLATLVQDVLDVARLDANRLKIEKTMVDVNGLARDALEAFREQARRAGVRLSLDVTDALSVEADARRVGQVFYNLLSNALKFTPEGGSVRIETRTDGRFAVVHFVDSGAGLDANDYSKLFQPFSQLDHTQPSGSQRGTGLGLFICQGIVEKHGGRIWCDSPGRGMGSTFSFALPLAKPAAVVNEPKVVVPIERKGPKPTQDPRRLGFWPIIYFRCPNCRSRDINMRVIRNRYECMACTHAWR